jgi:hypothetical protein
MPENEVGLLWESQQIRKEAQWRFLVLCKKMRVKTGEGPCGEPPAHHQAISGDQNTIPVHLVHV